MSIRVRSKGVGEVVVGAGLAVDITHVDDSIAIGDGTNTLTLIDSGGTKTIPVKIYGAGAGGTSAIDSDTFTPATTGFTPVGGVLDDTASDALTEGEMGVVRMTSGRAMHVYVAGQSGGSLTDAELRATAVPVSATSLPLPTGAATEATVDSILTKLNASVAVTGTFYQTTQPVSIASMPSTAVTGTFWQTTQPVSIASMPTTAVTGTFYQATQPVSGTVAVTGVATEAKQDTQITSLQLLDDVIIADNAGFVDGTTKVSMSGYVFDETAGTALTENDAAAARINANRAQVFTLEDGATRGRRLTVSAAGAALVDGSAITQPVSAASLPLPSGAATSALQTTGNTSLTTLAGAVSGTEMQCDVITLPAIPAGSNIIGKVSMVDSTGNSCMDDTNDALRVNIVAGAGSGGTAATDEAAFTLATTSFTPIGGIAQTATADALANGNAGVAAMTLNRALHVYIAGQAAGASGLTDTELRASAVPVSGTVSVTGVATETTAAAILADTAAMDTNLATLAGAVAGTEMQVDVLTMPVVSVTGTFYQATQPISAGSLPLPSGAATSALQTSSEALLTTIDADTSNLGGMATNLTTLAGAVSTAKMQVDVVTMPTTAVTGTFYQATQPVSGTVAATQSGTWNIGSISTLPAIPAGSNVIGAVTQSGTWNIGTVTTLPTVTVNTHAVTQSGSWTESVSGIAAHDAAVSGNPVLTAGRAQSTNPTKVADGDVSYIATDLSQKIITTPVANRILMGVQATTITSSTSETTIVTAGAAGVFNDICSLTITNASATALIVTLKDSTAGTTRAIYALAANGGITIPFPTPLTQATAANNWTLTCGTSVASIYVSAQYAART